MLCLSRSIGIISSAMVLAPGCPGDKVALHSLEWLADLAVRRIGEACLRGLPLNAALLFFLLVIRRGRYYEIITSARWLARGALTTSLSVLFICCFDPACTMLAHIRGFEAATV